MPIILTDFLGEVPRLDAEKLPEGGAQLAVDCQLRSGSIAPLTIGNPILQLWTGSDLTPQVTTDDVFTIAKPDPPSLVSLTKICQPLTWFQVWAYDWVSYIDASGDRVTGLLRSDLVSVSNIVYTEQGMWIVCPLLQRTYTFAYGGPYFFVGPRFQFVFYADPSQLKGGPDTAVVHPAVPSEFDPIWPRATVPLVDQRDNVYAQFQCVDYAGPDYTKEIIVTDYASIDYTVPGQAAIGGYSYVAFHINLNYARPTRRHYYYVQAKLVATGEPDEYYEGPPSELSDRITVRPGELPTVTLAAAPTRLYRSGTGYDDFLKLDDITSGTSFSDWDDEQEGIPVPPFGNHEGTFAAFTKGAFWHPAHFVVCLYDGLLWLSDTFRGWSFPKEFTLPFPGAFAHILTGNTVLVFDTTRVWAAAGNAQAAMQRYQLSQDQPLLNVQGLCRIGDAIFWPTYDGLAVSTGRDVKIVTEGHFEREQWAAYVPATMTCRTANNAVLIECADGTKFRFDLKNATLTRWTSTSPAGFTWKSKKFWSKEPVVYDYAIVTSAAEALLTVLQDGVETVTDQSITDAAPAALVDLEHSRMWEFEVAGTATVRRLEFYERVVVTVGDVVRLTPETSPIWLASYLRFEDKDRFCLGVLSCQGSDDATLTLYADGAEVHEETVSAPRRAFPLPRDLDQGTVWRVSVESAAYVDELRLYRRTAQAVGSSLREINNGPVAPWLVKRYELGEDRMVRSVRVHAAGAVTMNVYADGAETATESVAISGRGAVRLTPAQYGFVEFDFDGDDHLVYEVTVYAGDVAPVPAGPIDLSGGPVRGRVFRFAEPHSLACALVGLSDYLDATLTLYADGAQVYQAAVTGGQAFAFPKTLARGLVWEIDLDTEAVVDTFLIMPWKREAVASVSVGYTVGEGRIPPWMFTEYEFAAPVRIRSGEVRGLVYPVNLRLYCDGATAASQTVAVADRWEWRVASPVECQRLKFDFDADTGYDDGDLLQVSLFNEEVIPVEGGGLRLPAPGRPGWRNKILTFADTGSWCVARATASSYTGLNLILHAGGSDLVDEAAADDGEFIIEPGTARYRQWELDLAHQGDVRELQLIADYHYMLEGGAVIIRRDRDPWTWLQKRVICPKAASFSAIRVVASAYPVTVSAYVAGALVHAIEVADEAPRRILRVRPSRLWVFDCATDAGTDAIEEVGIAVSMQALRG